MTKFGQGVRSQGRVSAVRAGCPKLGHTTLLRLQFRRNRLFDCISSDSGIIFLFCIMIRILREADKFNISVSKKEELGISSREKKCTEETWQSELKRNNVNKIRIMVRKILLQLDIFCCLKSFLLYVRQGILFRQCTVCPKFPPVRKTGRQDFCMRQLDLQSIKI